MARFGTIFLAAVLTCHALLAVPIDSVPFAPSHAYLPVSAIALNLPHAPQVAYESFAAQWPPHADSRLSTTALHDASSSLDGTHVMVGMSSPARTLRETNATVFDDWGGGPFQYNCAVLTRHEGIDVFAIGSDNAVYTRGLHDGVQSDWVNLGGSAASAPSATLQMSGETVLGILGTDGHVWLNYHTDGQWSGFGDVGFSEFMGPPSLAGWYNQGLYVLSKGPGEKMCKLERRHNRYWFTGWSQMGNTIFNSDPVAIPLRDDLCDDAYGLAVDSEGVIRYSALISGVWTIQWATLDRKSSCLPAVSYRSGGFDVAICNLGGGIAVSSFTWPARTWGEWTEAGGSIKGRPAIAASASAAVIYLYGRGYDNALWVATKQDDDVWSDWSSMGGVWTSDPIADERENQYMDVWALDADGKLGHASTTYA